jgi:hypothetical protein
MSQKNSISSHSNNYDYYLLDYYDFEDTDSYYNGREDYLIKQQDDTEIINEKLISIPTLLERQENIPTLIGPALVGLFVLISSVTAVASMSAACASVAVAEALTNSTTSINLVCQINVAVHFPANTNQRIKVRKKGELILSTKKVIKREKVYERRIHY